MGVAAKLGQKLTKYKRGCPAGTGGHPESGTPSKIGHGPGALVCWSTAISKSKFTKNKGEPPLNTS